MKLPISLSHSLREVFSAYHSIVFLGYLPVGVLLCGLTWIQANIAASGLVALGTVLVLFRFLRVDAHSPLRTAILYNGLLVGLYAGYLFAFDALAVGLIILATCLTVAFTFCLSSFFYSVALPVLSVPFTTIGALLALAAPKFTNLREASYYFKEHGVGLGELLPQWVGEGLRSLGSVFCIPDWVFGAMILGIVLVRSPLTAVFLSSGLALGILGERLLTFNVLHLPMDHHYFNYALTFAALAGVFLVPSRFSLVVGAGSTLMAVLISGASGSFWHGFGVPILALPFNITVLLVLRTLKTVHPWQFNAQGGASPEEALERARLMWLRHRATELGVYCPFEGEWVVQQGFRGPWTHQGNWQHALDFVKQDAAGKTYKNNGSELEDYLAFGQAVLSPVEGYVVSLYTKAPDNPIGKVENQKNWGNIVVIRTLAGAFITLAHLKKDSISVVVGEYVFVGKKVGACGNSGYSQEPHLHLQAQVSAELGAFTHPFHLMNYYSKRKAHFHRVPLKGERIEPFNFNLALDRLLTFRVGEVQTWSLKDGENQESQFKIEHQLDALTGLPFFTDGKSRLSYSRLGAQFYFYGLEGAVRSPLWDLMVSAPRIPIGFGKQVVYRECLPLVSTHGFLRRVLLAVVQLLSSRLLGPQAVYCVGVSGLKIRGCVILGGRKAVRTSFVLDPVKGPVYFKVGHRLYERVVP